MPGVRGVSDLVLAVIAIGGSAFIAVTMLSLVDASLTWAVLILLALMAVGTLVWLGDVKASMLGLFLFTVPIEISKALTAEASAYSPAFSLFLSDIPLVVLLGIWVFEKFCIEKRIGRPGRIVQLVLAFSAWSLFEAWRSPAGASYYIYLSNLKQTISLLVVADMVRNPRLLRVALYSLAAGLGAQLLMAAAQFITGSDLQIKGAKNSELGRLLIFEEAGGVHFRRLSGFLPHPNVFADYLTFVIPPLVTVVLLGKRTVGAWWSVLVVLTLGAFVALVMALSRGAWIACACSLLFVVLAGWRAGLIRSRQISALALVGMLGLGGLVAAFPAAIYRVTNSDQRSGDSRLAMIDQALLIISEHPVVGVGLAGYNNEAQTTIPSSFAGLLPAFRDTLLKGVVHNKYLLTFAELGVIGMGLFLALLVALACQPLTRIAWRDKMHYALVLGLAGSIVSQLAFFMFDHFSYDSRIQMLNITAGLILGLVHPARQPVRRAAVNPGRAGYPAVSIGRPPPGALSGSLPLPAE